MKIADILVGVDRKLSAAGYEDMSSARHQLAVAISMTNHLFDVSNALIAHIGAYGEVRSRDNVVLDLLATLSDLDS